MPRHMCDSFSLTLNFSYLLGCQPAGACQFLPTKQETWCLDIAIFFAISSYVNIYNFIHHEW